MQACQCCSRTLSTNEIAISMRLLGRDGRALFCRECLARELKISPELIDSSAAWGVPCLSEAMPLTETRRTPKTDPVNWDLAC